MSKSKKKQKFKKDTVKAIMPVSKPENKHMPICSAPGCKRRVSDARKSRCSRCGTSLGGYEDYYSGMYD